MDTNITPDTLQQLVIQTLKDKYDYCGDDIKSLGKSLNFTFNVDDTYFVKVTKIGELQSEDLYAAKVALVNIMCRNGLQVSNLIQTKECKNYIKIGTSYALEVHSWIPNVEIYTGRPGQLEQAAKAMAECHKSLDHLQIDEISTLKSIPSVFRGITEMGEKTFLEELTEYERRVNEVSPRLRLHLLRTIPLLREAYLKTPNQCDLDRGIIHADLHDLQMMFDTKTGDLKALIDWEGACYDTRVIDIGYTAERLSMDSKRLYADLDSPLQNFPHNLQKVDLFLKEYDKIRPLTSMHRQRIVDQLVLKYLNSNARLLRKVFYNGSSINQDNILLSLRILSPERLEDLREQL